MPPLRRYSIAECVPDRKPPGAARSPSPRVLGRCSTRQDTNDAKSREKGPVSAIGRDLTMSEPDMQEARALRERLLNDALALAAYLRDHLPVEPAIGESVVPALAREAAVLAPLYALSGRPYLLFTRRTAHLRKH